MKLFNNTKEWEYDSYIHKTMDKWLYYTEGYKISAELVESELINNKTDRDFLIYPLIFLNRHYLELKLKEIIIEGNNLINNKNVIPKGEHNILKLWNETLFTLNNIWSDFQQPPDSIVYKIQELHLIDLKSFSFRYPIDINGNENLKFIEKINYKVFVSEFKEIKDYLENIADAIYVIKEGQCENYDYR